LVEPVGLDKLTIHLLVRVYHHLGQERSRNKNRNAATYSRTVRVPLHYRTGSGSDLVVSLSRQFDSFENGQGATPSCSVVECSQQMVLNHHAADCANLHQYTKTAIIREPMNNMKILIADEVSDTGLQPLRSAGFLLERKTKLSSDDLIVALQGCEGLVVRSETKVTADVLSGAPDLRVVGRAGVGVDNIDVPAATARGIVVMNAPDGNTITTAEHTMALLIALARRVPQANSSLRSGKWERKSFIGVELQGKTLGIIGLGRIGRAVGSRARAFGMNIVAYDPFIAPEQARDLEMEVASLDDVFARADFLTVHTPLTAETRAIVDKEAFAKMKKGVRIINCARGGLVDEEALVDAIKSGQVAGAALDVFTEEPPRADHPLLALDEVIATPHLGASTTEAQEGVAFTVAEQMRDYLLSGALRGAVNIPALGAKELNALQPYIELAQSLGRFQAQLVDGAVREVRIEYAGEIVDLNAAPVTRSDYCET